MIITTRAAVATAPGDRVLQRKGVAMVRSADILAAGLASIALFVSVDISVGEPLALQPVEDREGRFVISVPPTWRVERSSTDLPALSALSPETPEAPSDRVEVFVRDMLFPLSPLACAQQVAIAMRMTIHEWTTLSEGADSVGGLAAYSRAYTWGLNRGAERRSLQTCVPLGRRVFVIIGTTMNSPSQVAQNLPEMVRIMATFRPGPAPVPPALEPWAGGNR